MEPEQPLPDDRRTWQEALNPRLAGRVLRPLVQPGVISASMGRGIIARMQQTGTPLPLMEKMLRYGRTLEDSSSARAPLVHAQALPAAEQGRADDAPARPVVQATARQAAGPAASATPPVVSGPARPVVQAKLADRAPIAPLRDAEQAPPERRVVPPAAPFAGGSVAAAEAPAPAPRPPDAAPLPAAPARPTPTPDSPVVQRFVLPLGRRRRSEPEARLGPEPPRTAAPPLIQRASREEPDEAPADAPPLVDPEPDEADAEAPRPVVQATNADAPPLQRMIDSVAAGRGATPAGTLLARTPERPRVTATDALREDAEARASVGTLPPAVAPLQPPGVERRSGEIGDDAPRRPLVQALPMGGPQVPPLGNGAPALSGRVQRSLDPAAPRAVRPVVAAAPQAGAAPPPMPARVAGGTQGTSSVQRSIARAAPAMATTVLQRQADDEASSAATAPAVVAGAAEAGRGAPGVDINQVAAQVYEILVRRLASERERRGL